MAKKKVMPKKKVKPERKTRKSNITKAKLKKMLAKYQIRDCQISLIRLTATEIVERTLMARNRIRDCVVRLDRPAEEDMPKAASNKKFLLASKTNPVRSVSWIPSPSSIQKKSAESLSALAVHQNENDVVAPKKGRRNVKRQRSKSMYAERTTNDTPAKTRFTIDDMHLEFKTKYNFRNRGLKPSSERQLSEPKPQAMSVCQKIYIEMKAKLAEKMAKKRA